MRQTICAFFKGNETLRLARISGKSICIYLCLGITYQLFYLHPSLCLRSEECTFAHVDLSPSMSKSLAQIKSPKNCLSHQVRIPKLYNVAMKTRVVRRWGRTHVLEAFLDEGE